MSQLPPSSSILALTPARVQRSEDGAWRSVDYGDVYFQPGCGPEESRFVFLEKNQIEERCADLWRRAALGEGVGCLTVAELGFGTGLNMMLVCKAWREASALYRESVAPKHYPRLTLISIEKHPIPKDDMRDMHSTWSALAHESAKLLAVYPPAIAGFHPLHLGDGVDLLLCLGDVAQILPQLEARVDAWFLDGFAPAKNAEMWADDLYKHLARLSAPGATLATFSAAGHVRRGLSAAGFTVSKVTGFGVKRDMTVAVAQGGAALQQRRGARSVAVVGTGLAGASVARALAEQGCTVSVYERHDAPAQEASGNPVGILYPKPTADASARGQLSTHGFLYTRTLLDRLCPQAFSSCGVLRLDMTDAARARGPKLAALHGFPPGFCDVRSETEYGTSALWHEDGGAVSPGDVVRALLDHPQIAQRYGVAKTLADLTGYDAIVLATANAVTQEVRDIPITPLRGQMITLEATQESQKLSHVICHEGYLTPALDGRHYAGATFQKEGPEHKGDHRGVVRAQDSAEIVADLAAAFPHFGFGPQHVIAARAAYRATTPDKMPVVGRLPGRENVFVCVGFGAHALLAAPLCGYFLASQVCGMASPIPTQVKKALDPARFLNKNVKKQ